MQYLNKKRSLILLIYWIVHSTLPRLIDEGEY